MISITTESGAVLTAPDSLEGLTKEELIHVLHVQQSLKVALGKNDKGMEDQQRLYLIYVLFQINFYAWVDLTEADQNKLRLATSWVDSARVTKLPFTYFDFKSTRYHLPKPGFADSSAVEVALGNIWYLAFANPNNPNTEALFHLLATVYRPGNPIKQKRWYQTGEKFTRVEESRKDFDTAEAEARAELFKDLPFGLAIALLQYWENMNSSFLKRYPDIFDKAGDDQEPLYQGGEGWIACLEEVGETGTYGTTEKVFMENVHTIFGYMRRKQIKVRKMEKEAEVDE